MAKPSDLERAIASFRAELAALEEPATRAVIDAYAPVRKRLIGRIATLAAVLDTKGTLTLSETMRLERATALLSQTEAELIALGRQLAPFITDAQTQAVALAGDHALGLALISALGTPAFATIEQTWNRLNTSSLEALAGRMSDGSPLRGWLDQFGPDTSQRLSDALRRGVAMGTNPRGIARMLENEVNIGGARLLLMSRTEILNAHRSATLDSYAQNKDILKGWIWICALSSRTCGACLSLSGSEHKLSETFQPTHPACRCSSIPWLKGTPNPIKNQGAEWFAKQSAAEQNKVLGIAGGNAYRNGEVGLHDFVHLDHNQQWGDSYRQSSLAEARMRATSPAKAPQLKSVASRLPETVSPERFEAARFASRDDADAWADKNFATWKDGITKAEEDGLRAYSGFDFRHINGPLRAGEMPPVGPLRDAMNGIDSVIPKGVINRDVIAYRGMGTEWLGDVDKLPGSIIQDKGFVSTGWDRQNARGWARSKEQGAIMEVFLPAGTRVAPLDYLIGPTYYADFGHSERELLLARGSRFRVISVSTIDDVKTIRAELLP